MTLLSVKLLTVTLKNVPSADSSMCLRPFYFLPLLPTKNMLNTVPVLHRQAAEEAIATVISGCSWEPWSDVGFGAVWPFVGISAVPGVYRISLWLSASRLRRAAALHHLGCFGAQREEAAQRSGGSISVEMFGFFLLIFARFFAELFVSSVPWFPSIQNGVKLSGNNEGYGQNLNRECLWVMQWLWKPLIQYMLERDDDSVSGCWVIKKLCRVFRLTSMGLAYSGKGEQCCELCVLLPWAGGESLKYLRFWPVRV